jgi:hypothetical protein
VTAKCTPSLDIGKLALLANHPVDMPLLEWRRDGASILCLSKEVSLHNYYSDKTHTVIIKSTRYHNLYFMSYILPLHVPTRVGHLQGAQCQCLAEVINNYNLLKLC